MKKSPWVFWNLVFAFQDIFRWNSYWIATFPVRPLSELGGWGLWVRSEGGECWYDKKTFDCISCEESNYMCHFVVIVTKRQLSRFSCCLIPCRLSYVILCGNFDLQKPNVCAKFWPQQWSYHLSVDLDVPWKFQRAPYFSLKLNGAPELCRDILTKQQNYNYCFTTKKWYCTYSILKQIILGGETVVLGVWCSVEA